MLHEKILLGHGIAFEKRIVQMAHKSCRWLSCSDQTIPKLMSDTSTADQRQMTAKSTFEPYLFYDAGIYKSH